MSMTYFAPDGNYGYANGMVVLDTTNWTGADWAELDEALDWDRVAVATSIANRHNEQNLDQLSLDLNI